MKKVVQAPAKVNLCLHVTGRREDGYHDLATLMQRVDIQDRLEISLSGGTEITACCSPSILPPGVENITTRAARLFLSYIREEYSVDVRIDKKIPAAAGMGGGSSNAASVLLALNEMLDANLSQSELINIGVKVGADVPFFLFEQSAAWATGVGEKLQAWPGLPPVTFVLVNPGIEVSTAWVFKTLGLTCFRPIAKIPRFPVSTSGLVGLMHNDLEVVTCQRYPVITTLKERLVAGGAAGSLMSGSGSTVFGVFDERRQAEKCATSLSGETDWWVQVVNPL
jgi:4-diphosphocytidyl-2-C-methyl-D-erythritol kinase